METILKIIQVILALSILILVHEFGHYFFARLFKIRVEKFYLFFDPWFSLVKFKPRNSDTEYGIGWLPLGGYCKISGMIDESMDKDAMNEEPKPWEFRSKPAWQRFFVMFGGVFFNFILAILIYSATLLTWGEEYLKNSDAVYGVQCNDLALKIGFQNGDKIISFDDNEVVKFHELQVILARNQATSARVIRNGESVTVNIDPVYLPAILSTPGMFSLRVPFVISAVPDTSVNASAGLLSGDRVVAIDSVDAFIIQDVQEILSQKSGTTVPVRILRGDETFEKLITIDNEGKLGIVLEGDITKFFNVTTQKYTLAGSIPAGFKKSTATIGNYFKELGLIFSPKTEAYKSVGSFISIGKIFPSSWQWDIFWNITAWLSIMLAVLNLLPIPALDGGHILFVLYEMATGRKPSDKFLEYAQIAGMFFLFGIMFLAFGNDIYRLFK
ncbi:MAG TPA: RIP metalloprotease RseP [Rikenellaceae bacterium]|jgi:regulator of sigma E protease|nr:MAG: RIP metalloprotease RseP [Bacteroidetes bacterium GWE2_40_15]PKP07626.1 MAG: RIP metalloprotease RseP [Bacteroidetes bacterium HGW-Bacteroidetes-5]HBZ25354.1 RIP metalloprotease RseP [Rikenellaceae bacterium]